MNVPAELKARPQWVCWRYKTVPGRAKPTKLPYRPNAPHMMASSTDPATWGTFEQASAVQGVDGIGYVFAEDDPFTGLDFDDCVTDGRVDPHVVAIVQALDSYTEPSPSRGGLHTLVEGEFGGEGRKVTKGLPWGGALEVYSRGRFFTFTGEPAEHLPATINRRQAQLDAVVVQFIPPKPEREQSGPTGGPGRVHLDDRELLDLAMAAANGPVFHRLWQGELNGYGSQSEADLALVNHLAFWTGGDPDRIDRMFRSSGLMREKWERAGYRDSTIDRALCNRTDYYTPEGSNDPSGGHSSRAGGWLTGSPMDPCAEVFEPLGLLDGFPFLHAGMAAIISGPTGKGRSSMIQACAYDAARRGLRVAYLGGEVTGPEFNARAALIAEKRGDDAATVRQELAKVRYLDLHPTLATARRDPGRWVAGAGVNYDVVINDALAATSRGHENEDYISFYVTLVEPLRTLGAAVVMLDNVGHSEDAQHRPIGASAKGSKADLMFSCSAEESPPSLRLKATKVRSYRAAFKKGAAWVCPEDTLKVQGAFGAAVQAVPIVDHLTAELLKLSNRVFDEGGWSSLALGKAVGRASKDRSFQEALGRLVTDHDWTVTGKTSDRRYRPDRLSSSPGTLGGEGVKRVGTTPRKLP